MSLITTIIESITFGFGVSLIVFALSFLYTVFIRSENRASPLILGSISFLLLWIGASVVFLVIV